MAWELCSKEDVKGIHPCQDEDLNDQWSNMVEAMIRQHLGTPYLGTTQTITNEMHSGDGTSVLRVKCPPISSVTSLLVNERLLTAADYVVFSNHVQLFAETFPEGTLNTKITYVSGSTDIPYTVRLAASAMIIAIINYASRRGADMSIRWGQIDNQVGENTPNVNIGLTSHLETIMKRTLRRPKVRAV